MHILGHHYQTDVLRVCLSVVCCSFSMLSVRVDIDALSAECVCVSTYVHLNFDALHYTCADSCMVAEKALFGEEHSSTRSSTSYLVQVLSCSNEHSQVCVAADMTYKKMAKWIWFCIRCINLFNLHYSSSQISYFCTSVRIIKEKKNILCLIHAHTPSSFLPVLNLLLLHRPPLGVLLAKPKLFDWQKTSRGRSLPSPLPRRLSPP